MRVSTYNIFWGFLQICIDYAYENMFMTTFKC